MYYRCLSLVLGGFLGLGTPNGLRAQQQHIAPTEALTPEQERASFKLPPGFEAQLVASEPDIQKPMQMAFDARGRLWVTTSRHYPFAEPDDKKATDKLYVLSDFGPQGKAGKVQIFAENLNIPIGVLPLPDGQSCIVSSVGRILKLTDTNADGRADTTEVLFQGFGTRDTHGMYNSFLLLPDGWVYACHGFANESRVRGKDGHEVHMQSGHTFRFRPDGSRIEVLTRGQVNPFGMTIDPWMNLYTADCHSKPITQLIRGAYYDSFGKPHDGLGYGPHATKHDHGSTALCGLAWYDDDHFPAQYRGAMFLGNVVTNRINWDTITWQGSTPVAVEQPDFLVSTDPWFRPVDIQLGPDGALYVSDFYNRIIGHYEVDLKHPLRDKDRGRIWRIVYKGVGNEQPTLRVPPENLANLGDKELSAELIHPNITIRMLAANEFTRRAVAKQDVPELDMDTIRTALSQPERGGILAGFLAMASEQAGVATQEMYNGVITHAKDPNNGVRIEHFTGLVIRGLVQRESWGEGERALVKDCVQSFTNARLLRAAVDGYTAHPHSENIPVLVDILRKTSVEDTHLRHAARIALRNSLATEEAQTRLPDLLKGPLADAALGKMYDDVFLGIPTKQAGWWYTGRLQAGTLDPAVKERAFEQIGRYGTDEHRIAALTHLAQLPDMAQQLPLARSLARGAQASGVRLRLPEALAQQITTGLADASDARVVHALELAQALRTVPADTTLGLVRDAKRSEPVRITALTALETGPRPALVATCCELLRDPLTPASLKERAAPIVAATGKGPDLQVLQDTLKEAPYKLAVAIATGLAGKPEGAEILFTSVKAGHASPRILQEKVVVDRLRASRIPNANARIRELTAGLPSVEARIQQLIAERAAGFKATKPQPALGKKLYATHCAACHQIAGEGGKVGPNLDGIGNRGLERLLEDTLDPNRNVDAAFRATTLNLVDGRTLTGLLTREEGEVLVLADAEGKEQRIPKGDVESRRLTAMSPMPGNIAEKLTPQEYYELLGYLLELRVKTDAK